MAAQERTLIQADYRVGGSENTCGIGEYERRMRDTHVRGKARDLKDRYSEQYRSGTDEESQKSDAVGLVDNRSCVYARNAMW